MKRLLIVLFLLFSVILLATACDGRIISITIVIPQEFVPYYHWLMDFPGWRDAPQAEPLHPIPMRKGYQSVTPIYDLMTVLKPAGNNRRIKS